MKSCCLVSSGDRNYYSCEISCVGYCAFWDFFGTTEEDIVNIDLAYIEKYPAFRLNYSLEKQQTVFPFSLNLFPSQ